MEESGYKISNLIADGGVSQNKYLMTFQCSLLDKNIRMQKSLYEDCTPFGVAISSGLAAGEFDSLDA